MTVENGAAALVYQALDQVLAHRTVSPGAPRLIFTAIDTLRNVQGAADQVRRAENIAIEIHRLQWALQRSDRRMSQSSLRKLKRFAADWINMRIGCPQIEVGCAHR